MILTHRNHTRKHIWTHIEHSHKIKLFWTDGKHYCVLMSCDKMSFVYLRRFDNSCYTFMLSPSLACTAVRLRFDCVLSRTLLHEHHT